jgi:hypothetical protein
MNLAPISVTEVEEQTITDADVSCAENAAGMNTVGLNCTFFIFCR